MIKKVVITSIVGLGVYAGINAYQNFEMPDVHIMSAYTEENLRLKQLEVDAYSIKVKNAQLDHDLKRVKIENAKIIAEFETMQQLERSQSLAWAVTTSQGLWYLSVGLMPVGAISWITWRIWRRAKQEDEDRLTVTIASGHYPLNREFIRDNGPEFFELIAQKALFDGIAKVEGARRVDLPSLTTYTHQPTVTHTNTSSHETRLDAADRAQAIDDKIAQAIKEALALQNLPISATKEATGPQCHTYALKPETNEKGKRVTVSQIMKHANDIALHLGVESVRIAQDKGYLACEIPRDDREFVQLDDILNARAWVAAGKAYALPIGLGKDSKGNVSIVDLAALPHLLVGGATGMGKSVAMRTIIHCLNESPNVRMILLDPKRVEFGPFRNLENVSQVASTVEAIDHALTSVIELMDQRADMFEAAGVVNIAGYNKQADETIPYVCVVVDEIADLFMTSETAEDQIIRLCQKARFCGIHIILATQRPDADIVSPLIRTNVQARLSVRCSAQGDSRVILGENGAESLLDKGDSLYKDASTRLTRIQTAFCEVKLAEKANENETEVVEPNGSYVVASRKSRGSNVVVTENQQEKAYVEEGQLPPNFRPTSAQLPLKGSDISEAEVRDMMRNGMSNHAITVKLTGKKGGRAYNKCKDEVSRIRVSFEVEG